MKGLQLENGSIPVGVFDYDGNILNTVTTHFFHNTHTDAIEEILGLELDQEPEKYFGTNSIYRFENNDPEQTFRRGRDVTPYSEGHGGFEQLFNDTRITLENDNFGPSIGILKNMFLVKGRLASVITSRGHCPDNFERCFHFLNSELLTPNEKREQIDAIRENFGLKREITDIQVLEYYFGNMIDYIPVNNKHVAKFLNLLHLDNADKKSHAIDWYIQDVKKKLITIAEKSGKENEVFSEEHPMALGFSDDSMKNISSMAHHITFQKQLGTFERHSKVRLYFTGPEKQFPILEKELDGIGDIKEILQSGKAMLQIGLNKNVFQ